MLTQLQKIKLLENYLNTNEDNYSSTLKTDIILFFNEDFTNNNTMLKFLHNLKTEAEIIQWVDKLTSRIVMHEDDDEVGEIIADYWELG